MVAFFLLQYTMASNEIPKLLLNRYFVIFRYRNVSEHCPLVMLLQPLETSLIPDVPVYAPQVHV